MLPSRPLPTETSASNESFARGGTALPSDEWCAARLPPSGWPANPVLEHRRGCSLAAGARLEGVGRPEEADAPLE